MITTIDRSNQKFAENLTVNISKEYGLPILNVKSEFHQDGQLLASMERIPYSNNNVDFKLLSNDIAALDPHILSAMISYAKVEMGVEFNDQTRIDHTRVNKQSAILFFKSMNILRDESCGAEVKDIFAEAQDLTGSQSNFEYTQIEYEGISTVVPYIDLIRNPSIA